MLRYFLRRSLDRHPWLIWVYLTVILLGTAYAVRINQNVEQSTPQQTKEH